jgi:uncharacterized RDD family membrane protein YckC
MVTPPVDNRISIETPEGVEFVVDAAGPLPRILAAAFDMTLRSIAYMFLASLLGMLGDMGTGLLFICVFTIEWGYPIYFEMYHRGQTPGKMMMKLQTLHADGTPISWQGSILRNLLRVADFLPFGYVAGVVSMVMTGKFQRLGDLAADTIVCYRPGEVVPPREEAFADAEPVVVSEPLSLEEQKAIVSFAERSQRFGPERAQELAAIVEPLTGSASGKNNLQFLRGLANRIVRWA